MLMFPDASDLHWGSFFTQVLEKEFRSGVALENMSHEHLAFRSGFTVALGDCGQGRYRNREHFSQAGILAFGWGSYLYRSSQSHVHFQPQSVRNVCY